jgi:hypothetical protein
MDDDASALYRRDPAVAVGSRNRRHARIYGLPAWAVPAVAPLIVGLLIWAVTGAWLLMLPAIGVAGVVIVMRKMQDKIAYYQSRGE